MDMSFSNRAMAPMTTFAIQLNKNSFGVQPAQPLQVRTPLQPNASVDTSLSLNTAGAVQKMEPLCNLQVLFFTFNHSQTRNILQVAVKNDVDVLYFACVMPMHIFFADDGLMEKMTFLQSWQEIASSNEKQYTIENTRGLRADAIIARLQVTTQFLWTLSYSHICTQANNVFPVAQRTVDGRNLLYHSVKFTNNLWLMAELNLAEEGAAGGGTASLAWH